MWFKVLGLVIAVALLGKATVALTATRRFYALRQRQYAPSPLTKQKEVIP
jgi:FlaG/FlaF family flagellin (archaellin)